ncbi:MAG: type 1 glutamine amidotransferase [Bryobacteraceae bacterium]
MHILAFRHAPAEGIGSLADALARYRVGCRTIDLYREPEAACGLEEVAGVILMGGPMSVNDELAWIPREVLAIQGAGARGIPVLGICLGSQLIARALGARVYGNAVKEIGWSSIRWTEAAQGDALFTGFEGAETVFQWHGDTFDLPAGAELLAESAACRHQAFRAGGNVYGLQFHLEVTPEIIEDWLRQDAACGAGREAVAPVDAHDHADGMAALAATVFGRWCELLR